MLEKSPILPVESLSSEEAETTVLGALMISPRAWADIAGLVAPEDFSIAIYNRMFAEIGRMIERGEKPSPITLARIFGDDPDLHEIGGKQAIAMMAASTFLIDARECAVQIRDLACRRAAVEKLDQSRRELFDLETPFTETAASLATSVAEIRTADARAISMHEVVKEIVDEMRNPLVCDSTGFRCLDDAMDGGLYRGFTYGLCAQAKVGKTTFAHSISYNLNQAGVRHLYVALEMGYRQIVKRLLAKNLGVNSTVYQKRRDGQFQDLTARAGLSMNNEAYFLNMPGTDFETLKGVLSRAVMQDKIKGAIIDYLQLIGGIEKGQTEEAHLRRVSQWLANFGRRHGIWIIVIGQLNKDGDVFGGGGLTKACDQLYFLNRSTINGCEDHAWIELKASRYTPMGDVGSEDAPTLLHVKNAGPYFVDFHNAETGEFA